MSRYDDRFRGSDRRDDRGGGGGYRGGTGGRGSDGGPDAGGTRLYVGRLSTRTRSRDLEDLFAKYGRVRDVDVKHDFAFVEFADARDADDARHYCNGKDFDGNRLIVEFARRGPRSAPGGTREYLGRGPPPGTGRCYNCGNDGHWARDCKAGDWRDKCYRCGQRGHIERNCRNSPKPNSSHSRSRSRSPRGHGRSRKSVSRSRSRSYSRSPPRRGRSSVKGDGSLVKGDYSPMAGDRSPVKSRKASRSKSRSCSPAAAKDSKCSNFGSPAGANGRSMSQSPSRSRSPRSPEAHYGEKRPASLEKRRSVSPSPEPDNMDKDSPVAAGGVGRSPTPEE